MSRLLMNKRFLRTHEEAYPHRTICGKLPSPQTAHARLTVDFIRVPITTDHVVWGFRDEAGLSQFLHNFKEFVRP